MLLTNVYQMLLLASSGCLLTRKYIEKRIKEPKLVRIFPRTGATSVPTFRSQGQKSSQGRWTSTVADQEPGDSGTDCNLSLTIA